MNQILTIVHSPTAFDVEDFEGEVCEILTKKFQGPKIGEIVVSPEGQVGVDIPKTLEYYPLEEIRIIKFFE